MKTISMIFKIAALFVLILMCKKDTMGQTTEEFRSKYGQEVTTQFNILPGIIMNVYMSESGKVCKILIKKVEEPDSNDNFINEELAKRIIDDIVPDLIRGNYQSSGNAEFSSICSIFDTYENVMINKSCKWTSDLQYKVKEILIVWKDTKCICDNKPLFQSKDSSELK